MVSRQMEAGKAFEYACLAAFSRELAMDGNVPTKQVADEPFHTARECYYGLAAGERHSLDEAAGAASRAIVMLEPTLLTGSANDPVVLSLQPDKKGMAGDVRDLVLSKNGWEVGISCKHNHDAVKHSRLSATIDFGREWLGFPCSDMYWSEVRPLFEDMRRIQEASNRTALRPEDKVMRYYVPVLRAFVKELSRLDREHPLEVPARLIHYLIGREDFYKVIANEMFCIDTLQAINIHGTLAQPAGGKLPLVALEQTELPTMMPYINFVEGSSNTVMVVCDRGWQISMRIHNASRFVEPSLKFDVRLDSMPNSIHTQVLPWRIWSV